MTLSAEDVIAIHQLVARYAHAADNGDGAMFAATFAEDGSMGTVAGRAELAVFGACVPTRRPGVRHWMSNILVEDGADADTATMRSYLRMTTRTGPDDSVVEVSTGCYHDQLVKIDGEWLFKNRQFQSFQD